MSIDLHGPGLWYATRATGLVTLLLLTASVLLGMLTAGRFAGASWPRFLTLGLHRNLSLLVAGVPGAARGHDRGRHLYVDPADRRVHPVRLVLQGGLAEPRRGRARPAPRPGGDQPDPEPARAPGLAPGALGWPTPAGRSRWRTALASAPTGAPVGVRAQPGLRRWPSWPRRPGAASARPGQVPGDQSTALIRPTASPPGTPCGCPACCAGVSYGHPTGLAGHEELYGPLPLPARTSRRRQRPERLIDLVERSGLTGRGGAGFPTGRKMRSVAAGPGRKAVVRQRRRGRARQLQGPAAADPAAAPGPGRDHAGRAGGRRRRGVPVRARARSRPARPAWIDAVAERETAGLDPVPIQVTGIPGRYVSSEQSSIVQYLNGGPAKPTFSPAAAARARRARPAHAGAQRRDAGAPGADRPVRRPLVPRCRDCRRPRAPCWSRWAARSRRPGVYEIEMGTTAGEVVMLAGGPAERLQALLVGGYFGAWLPAEYGLAGADDPRGAARRGRRARARAS